MLGEVEIEKSLFSNIYIILMLLHALRVRAERQVWWEYSEHFAIPRWSCLHLITLLISLRLSEIMADEAGEWACVLHLLIYCVSLCFT